MKVCVALAPLLFAISLFGQITPIISPFPPQLKQYLELSDEQARAILEQNTALQNFQGEKARRILQVQLELNQEIAKPTIDPMALGLRHLELESIRRELQSQSEKTAAAIENVFNATQKAKLLTLRQAMQLSSIICEAQAVNVLPPGLSPLPQLPIPIPVPANRRIDISSLLLAPSGGCAVRTGSFVFNPNVP